MAMERLPDIAFSPPETIRKIQEARLRSHLAHCRRHSPYYRHRLEGVDPDGPGSWLEQLPRLPLTQKTDFDRYNDDFCAVPLDRIVDIVLSSGTTGRPTRVMYTEHDLERLAYNEEKSFAGCGVTAKDCVLLTCTMDRCFVAGLAYFLGIRGIGAAAIRNGLNSLESQAELIQRLDPTVVVGVPTFLNKLGHFLQDRGTDPARTAVSKMVCIGEPLRDRHLDLLKVGRELETLWQARVFSTYASSEIVTTFCECEAQCGGHLHPDLAVVEIVDKTGAVVPPGTIGDIVVTPLGIEGMPLLRYNTGDVGFLMDTPCRCGRITPRLGPILGRHHQMMKIQGTTVYPQAVYNILEEISAIDDYYLEITSQSDLSDRLAIHAAVTDPSVTVEMIRNRLQAGLRVKPAVILEDEKTVREQVFPPRSRKPVRFVDRRK